MGDPAQGEGVNAKPEDDWTAVSKPPPRRLAPQHTLSKADLGADSPRNKAAIEISKKKGARRTIPDFHSPSPSLQHPTTPHHYTPAALQI